MTHYILVHGAWEGPWTWDETARDLRLKGHTVSTVDLPGSISNPKDIADVTMAAYVQTVVDAIKPLDHKVTLVGHSMAGPVISLTAEALPEKIDRLIYVAAFMLKSGDSVIEAMQRDPGGEFLPELTFSDDGSYVVASEATMRSKAFHDVDEAGILHSLPLLAARQATEPFMAKVVLTTNNFGSVPKTFIRTSLDKMVSPILQDEMLEGVTVDKVLVAQSGHFPTLSMPKTLVDLLL